jgi:hypothetical protein
MKKTGIAGILASMLFAAGLCHGGTLILKDGKKISDVKIISISDGKIIIEKDRVKETVSLSSLSGYYDTNMKEASDGAEIGDYADYDVSVDVDMPDRGMDKKSKNKGPAECVIKYNIMRKGPHASVNRAKMPYFYLYILTWAKEEEGSRNINMFCYPKQASVRSKGYDKAAIIDNIKGMDRPNVNFDKYNGLDTPGNKDLLKGGGEREARIPLGKIGDKKIVAWHLEVWGTDTTKPVTIKDWKEMGSHLSTADKWWERY